MGSPSVLKTNSTGAVAEHQDAVLAQLNHHLVQALSHNPRSPKYSCLRDVFIEQMASGLLPPGYRLPTEQVLAAALPVSLGTVQKALRDLVTRGDLVRHRKRGTFVASGDHRREIGMPAFYFLRPNGDRVKMVFSRLRTRRHIQHAGPWSEVLGPCADGYVHIERLDQIDGVVHAHSAIYLRADLAAGLLQLAPEQLEHESVIPLIQSMQPLGPMVAESRVSLCRIPRRIQPLIHEDSEQGLRLDVRYHQQHQTTLAWMVMTMPHHNYQIVTGRNEIQAQP